MVSGLFGERTPATVRAIVQAGHSARHALLWAGCHPGAARTQAVRADIDSGPRLRSKPPPGNARAWTGVNSCGNIREGDHPDASDARGDARARPMRHLQIFDRRPTQAGACPSCARPPPARAHHAAGRARADRAARAVGSIARCKLM